jgi:hypothetical protein
MIDHIDAALEQARTIASKSTARSGFTGLLKLTFVAFIVAVIGRVVAAQSVRPSEVEVRLVRTPHGGCAEPCGRYSVTAPKGHSSPALTQSKQMSLDAHIQHVIGSDAVDCGTYNAPVPPVPDAMHRSLACAREAIKRHDAFRFVQFVQGEDSVIAFGALGERSGSVVWFDYDSAPCGGPGCAESFVTTRCALDEVIVAHEATGFHRFRRMR